MQDGFKFFPGGGIGKNDLRQLITAQLAVGGDNALAENRLDFRQGGLAGFNELPRQLVRVHDLRAMLAEKLSGGGFAHAHAAGQTEKFHRRNDKDRIYLCDEKFAPTALSQEYNLNRYTSNCGSA
jgi:hypothetical protein